MIKKICIFLLFFTFNLPANAGVCDEYKKDVDLDLSKSTWKTNIKPSDTDLWPKGGFVEIQPFNTVEPKIGYAFNGKYYCVFLDSVKVVVGFKDFEITIDKKYKKDSCEYNAVLEHENHHIDDSVKALDKVYSELKPVLKDVVNSVEPIYVEDADEVPYVFEKIEDKIMHDKKIKKLVDEFQEQQSNDADALDEKPDEKLQKCTKDKIDAAFEKYYKKKGVKK